MTVTDTDTRTNEQIEADIARIKAEGEAWTQRAVTDMLASARANGHNDAVRRFIDRSGLPTPPQPQNFVVPIAVTVTTHHNLTINALNAEDALAQVAEPGGQFHEVAMQEHRSSSRYSDTRHDVGVVVRDGERVRPARQR